MRVLVSALLMACLVLIVGCDSNDENTINPIAKFHTVHPVIHVKVDNNFQQLGIDSLMLVVSPSVGTFAGVPIFSDTSVIDTITLYPGTDSETVVIDTVVGRLYTDDNGYIGLLPEGTFISSIDTIVNGTDTTVDTTAVVFGLTPGQTYTLEFTRSEIYTWDDIFRVEFATTIDSQYLLVSSESKIVTNIPDPATTPDTRLDSVGVIEDPADTVGNQPDSTSYEVNWFGEWSDSIFVLLSIVDDSLYDSTNIDSDLWNFWKVFFDSVYVDSIWYGYWLVIDSFYIEASRDIWCDVIDTTVDTNLIIEGPELDTVFTFDTVFAYSDCDSNFIATEGFTGDSTIRVTYRDHIWGSFPGGDTTRTPVASFDTIVHSTLVDTTKTVTFAGSAVTITDIMGTRPAKILLKATEGGLSSVITELDSMTVQIQMPPVEIFPDYEIIIKDE